MNTNTINGTILLSQLKKGELFSFITSSETYEFIEKTENNFFYYNVFNSKLKLSTSFDYRVKYIF